MQDINDIEGLKININRLFDLTVKQIEILFNAYANENFLDGEGTKKKLAIRTGKLARSLIKGKEGNITIIKKTPETLTIEIGTSLKYGLIWESGFNSYKVAYTRKQLGFLFAKFKKEGTLNTNKNKKADGYLHYKKQNARPFLLPASKKLESEGHAIIEKFFIAELNKLYK